MHDTLGFITIYQSINAKCFEIPQCFTCMMILWFYAILHVFVLYSHYDYNISSKKLNAHRLWNLWASKEHSFFFWNITFHNRNAGINFIQNHPPPGQTPGDTTRREQKPSPRDNNCVQKPFPRDKTGSQKPHPRDIKLDTSDTISNEKLCRLNK